METWLFLVFAFNMMLNVSNLGVMEGGGGGGQSIPPRCEWVINLEGVNVIT